MESRLDQGVSLIVVRQVDQAVRVVGVLWMKQILHVWIVGVWLDSHVS